MAHSEHQLRLPMRTEGDADPSVANALATAKAGIGMIPNMYANMANAPGLLETYLKGYAAFRKESGFTPSEQETVFLTISRFNRCDYCMGAHSAIADMSKVPTEITDAVRDGAPIADDRIAALSQFTEELVASRGLPTADQVDAFLATGYTETQLLYLVLAVGVKTLSNYSNHLFRTPLDPVFADRAWEG